MTHQVIINLHTKYDYSSLQRIFDEISLHTVWKENSNKYEKTKPGRAALHFHDTYITVNHIPNISIPPERVAVNFLTKKLWWPFCSAKQSHYSNFGKGSPKKHSCEIILKSGHWCRSCHLKFFFSIFSSGGHFVEGMAFKCFSIFSSGGHFVQQS